MLSSLRLCYLPIVFVLIGNLSGALAQAPRITFFSPASGAVGTTVRITGTGFAVTAADNAVYFGAVRATVLAASGTQLAVKVPIGATSVTPITVTNLPNGLIGSSATAVTAPVMFTVTFPDGDVRPEAYLQTDFANSAGRDYLDKIATGDFNGDR